MKYLLALSALLAAASTTTADEVCSATQQIMYNEKDIGYWLISDINNNMMRFEVTITNTPTEGLAYPYLDRIWGQVCCAGDSDNTLGTCSPMKHIGDDTHTKDLSLSFEMSEPTNCGEGVGTDVKLRFFIEESGGIEAYTDIFPPPSDTNAGGVAIKFSVHTDGGTDTEASYFDACFSDIASVPEALQGECFNGYCVDAENYITTGHEYNGIAYSYFGTEWTTQAARTIGNIDKPWNMPNVAYCINKWTIGNFYNGGSTELSGCTYNGATCGFPNENYQLSSGTIQRAIWGLVDDRGVAGGCSGTGCSLGANSMDWAQAIANECLENGNNFEPECGDKVPIVVVITDAHGNPINKQNQYVQTTFAELGIPCEETEYFADAQTNCITGGSGSSGGDPHFKTFGEQWFGTLG